MSTIDAMKQLAEWHSKTSKLWPVGMEQSTFHIEAAITLHEAIAREEAQADAPTRSKTITKADWVSDLQMKRVFDDRNIQNYPEKDSSPQGCTHRCNQGRTCTCRPTDWSAA